MANSGFISSIMMERRLKKKSGKEIDIEENGIFYIGNLKCIILSKQIAVFFL